MHARRDNVLVTKTLYETDKNPYIKCFGREILENIGLCFRIISITVKIGLI